MDEPCPSRPEAGRAGGGELLLELCEVAKGRTDRLAQATGRLASSLGGVEPKPEERVIPVTAAVVAHGGADTLRHLGEPHHEVIERTPSELRCFGDGGVEVGDVRAVVLVVMDLHRLGVNMRLERIEAVR